ncbi:hypothetical protein JD969_12230 [Planctomycetota bacterium]|nr:hypothetical protein JD969_12230 [Planctomycetota bacterium]
MSFFENRANRAIGFGGTLGGILLLISSYTAFTQLSSSKNEPQTITAQQLITEGYGDNLFMTVTNYTPLLNAMIVKEDDIERSTMNRGVWVPITPKRTSKSVKKRPECKVILYSRYLYDPEQINAFSRTKEFTGLVVDNIPVGDKINSDAFSSIFPDADFDNILIIEHNKKPPGYLKVVLLLLAGLIITPIGLMGLYQYFKN